MLAPEEFFDLTDCPHAALFSADQPVWAALDRLKQYLAGFFQGAWPLQGVSGEIRRPVVLVDGEVREDLEVRTDGPKGSVEVRQGGEIVEGASVILPGAYLFDDRVILGAGTVVEPSALIKGPAVFGARTEVRHGAYVRGDCLVGSACVVGHTTEMKGSIMLDGAKAGHFAYIGDSILGKDVNLGAGTKLANLRMIAGKISLTVQKERIDTGRRKLGGILGDRTETGCNSVLSPGTLLGPRSIVYPAIAVPGGVYPRRTVVMPTETNPRTIVLGKRPSKSGA